MPLDLNHYTFPYGGGGYGAGFYGGGWATVTPPVTVPVTGDGLLGGHRVTSYRFDLLAPRGGNREALVGELDGVTGGSVDWSAASSVKGGGMLDVIDVGQDVDWLNVRIRPVALIEAASDSGPPQEVDCGVFLPAAPVEGWNALGLSWSVELLDKTSILDQDIVTDTDGNPVTVSFPAGSNVIREVLTIIEDTGETAPAIEPDHVALSNPMTWDAGTTRLKIVNDLLDAANYFSIWCDGSGQFRTTPYTPPSERPVVYEVLDPFNTADGSLMAPDWTRDRDIYSVPNRYVAVGQGSEDEPALTGVATNTDEDSPYSYPSRGRWITEVATGVEAIDEAALEAYATRMLANATSVTSAIEFKHLFLPDLLINTVIRFRHDDIDLLCSVGNTSIEFDPLALSSTRVREVIS